jgi:hypothetical protein
MGLAMTALPLEADIWRQRPPEPPPLRRRYRPSLWRGFAFDLEVVEDLAKYLHRLRRF